MWVHYWKLVEAFPFINCSINVGPGWYGPIKRFCNNVVEHFGKDKVPGMVRVVMMQAVGCDLLLNYRIASTELWNMADLTKEECSATCEFCASREHVIAGKITLCEPCQEAERWRHPLLRMCRHFSRFQLERQPDGTIKKIKCVSCPNSWKPGARPSHKWSCTQMKR